MCVRPNRRIITIHKGSRATQQPLTVHLSPRPVALGAGKGGGGVGQLGIPIRGINDQNAY